ncbi:alkaline serine protease [Bdellovibrio sp. qaytius]|nr:alkaline serine protease [Bdellovibrio sp. qaytius]
MRTMQNKLQKCLLVLGLVILTGCNNSKTKESVFAETAQSYCESNTLKNRYVVQWEDGSITVETTDTHISDDHFRETFVKDNLALIKHVDRDFEIKLRQATSSDVHTEATNLSWGPERMVADQVWAQGYKGQGIKVGVVDGMVDATHVQLAGNVISTEQFNNEVNDPNLNIHGTHVAGIIAADPNLGPVGGVAPSAKIIAGQFISNAGGGSLGDAILAMNSVANKGARIINMSWGGAGCVTALKDAIQALSNRGILIVTAAGNDGVNSDYSPDYPAAFRLENQINVAATTIDDRFISFSNRGVHTVNVGAPGVSIYSTIPGNRVDDMDGTSMAAPMVSGAAALLMSALPAATAQQIKQAIYTSVDFYPEYQVSTHGRVNVKKALDALRAMLTSP